MGIKMEQKTEKRKKRLCIGYSFWWKVLPFIGLAVWGAFCISPNLWYDEAYSASMVSRSWMDLIYITAVDDHSPFYYVLLKIFYHLCGGGTHFWALKLLSVLFMFGYLLLGKYYIKKLFDEQTSVWFMVFSLFMPIMTVQAGNVRMYAAALFFMTLAGLSAADLYRGNRTFVRWTIFCLSGLCAVYCHTFAMIQMVFLYLLFLGAILIRKKFSMLKGYFISGITVSVIYSPWLLVTLHQMQLRIANDSGARSAEAIPTLYTFMDYCKEWFSALETPIPIVVFAGMGLTVFLGYYAVDRMRSQKEYSAGLGMAAIGLTALTGALVSLYVNPCFLGRYAFPGFGSLALWYATGMRQISSRKIKTVVFAVAAGCFLAQYASELSLEYDPGLQTYETFLKENVKEEDCIMGPSEHTIFLNVYHPEKQYFLYGYKLYSLPFVNTDAFTQWYQLEDRGGTVWYICFDGDTPDRMAERYTWEEALRFHYMYYDFVIYKLQRNSSARHSCGQISCSHENLSELKRQVT